MKGDVAELKQQLAAARAQQAASAAILKVIARSPADAQPVFDAIARNVLRLLGTHFSAVQLVRDGNLHLVGFAGPGFEKLQAYFPQPVDADTAATKALKARRVVQIVPIVGNRRASKRSQTLAKAFGYDAIITVPMMRKGKVIGAIATTRRDALPFDARQEALLKGFADQAVIAIENARLFNETKDALERQTATAEILKVIASSPSNVQPVFDAIVESAARLFGRRAGMRVVEGNVLRRMARSKNRLPGFGGADTMPIDRDSLVGCVALEGKAMQLLDTRAPEAPPYARANAGKLDFRSNATAPLIRERAVIGTISVSSPEPGALSPKEMALLTTFADQAVIAIENVRLFNETREALERQTATADVLKVIASSPSDVQPVFNAILRSAVNLCGAEIAAVFPYDGKLVHLGATHNWTDEAKKYFSTVYPSPPSPALMSGRTILSQSVVKLADAAADGHYDPNSAATGHWRRMLGVPMMREGEPLGALVVCWREPGETPQRQVDLLQTFADQAVIAIENVRLFNETKEALEQQTATAEILQAISSSPTDTQPVFDVITQTAARLMAPASVGLNMRDGAVIRLGGFAGPLNIEDKQDGRKVYPIPFDPATSFSARSMASGSVLELPDTEAPEAPAVTTVQARAVGYRSLTQIPLMREGIAIGTLGVTHPQPGFRLTFRQLALMKTFADQAVIAIENVRLFNETKESLERQTATAEILRVIASSPSDVQPVFDAIVGSAVRLVNGFSCVVARVVGDDMHLAAYTSMDRSRDDALTALFPQPITRNPIHAKVIQTASVQIIGDLETDPRISQGWRQLARARGYRSTAIVPMVRDHATIGLIYVTRVESGPFSEHHVELLKTFADQAVIAIENVRLFNETKESLERQTATAEILKVIASSPSDVQPVFDAIVTSARQLIGGFSATVTRVIGDSVHLVAFTSTDPSGREALQKFYPAPISRGSIGKAIRARAPAYTIDTENDAELSPESKTLARTRGYRSMLNVPMMREQAVIGTINVSRREPGSFAGHQIELLKTFADQAVIAIENVRLFNETKEALERQTATAEILKVIASSPSDVQPVFDAIVASALHLMRGATAHVTRLEGGQLHLVAYSKTDERGAEALQQVYPMTLESYPRLAEALADRTPRVVADVETEPTLSDKARAAMRARGVRSNVIMPMVLKDSTVGTLVVNRTYAGGFTPHEIALLRTFADQAVIAIENVRLFNETKEALERQTATADILQVISGSVSDATPVFDKILASCERLFSGDQLLVFLVGKDEALSVGAIRGPDPDQVARTRALFPVPLAGTATEMAIRERRLVTYADVLNDPDVPDGLRRIATQFGENYSLAIAPMLWDGRAIGSIMVGRATLQPFNVREQDLLKTFAEQAVIAIHNARLFNETKEALSQQTASAEILAVIGNSMTDARPVFNAIVKSCHTLFGVGGVSLRLVRGENLVIEACIGDATPSVPIDRGSAVGTCVLDAQAVHLPDLEAATERFPRIRQLGLKYGYHSGVYVPLLQAGVAIGTIAVLREQAGAFSEKEVALLKSFADQAVIAIQNVHLFKELQSRTDALTKSVGQLTALGEVGQAISSSLDLETVLKTIVDRAMQLAALDGGVIYEYDEQSERFSLRASENFDEENVLALRGAGLRKGEGAVGTSVATREPVQVPDTHAPGYPARLRGLLDPSGFRAVLAVPLLREEHVIGALMMLRKTPGEFAPEVVELLKTFATQSAMAIQNARLFREIAEKGKQLEIASRHKSDFLASMSHELRTPLNAILGFNEMLIGQVYGEVPADMQDPLNDIQKSGKHLLGLINNVLDLAKIESGRMELALSDYSVQDIVDSVHSTLRPLAADKGLQFLASAPADIPFAHGDSGRIRQCLMNLAGNSIKFTKTGSVEISVAEKGDWLTYRVADTGIGIAPDKIGGLFTEFKQTDATVASEYGGTGLGLSISKKFVEMHGGRIWIESELGKGSAFIFEIPLRVGAT